MRGWRANASVRPGDGCADRKSRWVRMVIEEMDKERGGI